MDRVGYHSACARRHRIRTFRFGRHWEMVCCGACRRTGCAPGTGCFNASRAQVLFDTDTVTITRISTSWAGKLVPARQSVRRGAGRAWHRCDADPHRFSDAELGDPRDEDDGIAIHSKRVPDRYQFTGTEWSAGPPEPSAWRARELGVPACRLRPDHGGGWRGNRAVERAELPQENAPIRSANLGGKTAGRRQGALGRLAIGGRE